MSTATDTTVETPYGAGRLVVAAAPHPVATLLLSHGAGNGIETADLAGLAGALPGQGITVALFEQPWRVAGRPVASAPATLDVGLTAAAAALPRTAPLVLGGRSAGARSACRTATALEAAAVLALAFPLHPPGKPERTRVAELATGVPTLVVQGERDPFGRPEEFPAGTELVPVPGADHGFKTTRASGLDQADVVAIIVEAALEWVVRVAAGPA